MAPDGRGDRSEEPHRVSGEDRHQGATVEVRRVDDGHDPVVAVRRVDLLVLRVVVDLIGALLPARVQLGDDLVRARGPGRDVDGNDAAVVQRGEDLVRALRNDDAVWPGTQVDR